MVAAPAGSPLLILSAPRRVKEVAHAAEIEAAHRSWRRRWQRVYAECILCFLAGYILYGIAWGTRDSTGMVLLSAAAFFLSYALPLMRLALLLIRHGEQF